MRRSGWLLCLALTVAHAASSATPALPLPRRAVEEAGVLLGSRDAAEVRRGLDRLGRLGTPRALDLLARALDTGAAARGLERLIAVHAVAPHARQPEARAALIRVLRHADAEEQDPLALRARTAAALALARAGDPEAVGALLGSLGQGGEVQAAALEGLRAFPPRTLPLTSLSAPGSAMTLRALAELVDPRLLETFRAAVRSGDAEARAVAAVALARLGDGGAQALIPGWSRSATPALRLAAHELAWLTGQPLDEAGLGALMRAPETRERALVLALRSPRPTLVMALEEALQRAQEPERRRELALALATAGGPGMAALERALARPAPAAALEALARTPGAAARAVLARALRTSGPSRSTGEATAARARAVRTATLHRLLHGVEVPGRAAALTTLARSPEVGARATVAWCSAVLGPTPSLARLERESDPALRAALSLALLDPRARTHASRELLESLLEAPAPAPCLAAWALAERTAVPARWLVERPHAAPMECVAAGLAVNREGAIVAAVEERWLSEPAARVRRAMVAVASGRHGPARDELLARMAWLDPDASVRAAARWARGARGSTAEAPAVGAELRDQLLAWGLDPDGTAPARPAGPPGLEALTMLDSGAW